MTNVPGVADSLWIHPAVAEALNAKDAKPMRSGFAAEFYNQRGVHGFSAGREERELSRINRERAEALEILGYSRFATAMRELADNYEQEAEREASRDPYRE